MPVRKMSGLSSHGRNWIGVRLKKRKVTMAHKIGRFKKYTILLWILNIENGDYCVRDKNAVAFLNDFLGNSRDEIGAS